jgi:hypothetical protein
MGLMRSEDVDGHIPTPENNNEQTNEEQNAREKSEETFRQLRS